MPTPNPNSSTNSGNRAGHPRKSGVRRNGRAKPTNLEDAIVSLAAAGKLEGAGRAAIRAQHRAGLPATYLIGRNIVAEYPDGRKEILRALKPVAYKIPKGIKRLRGA